MITALCDKMAQDSQQMALQSSSSLVQRRQAQTCEYFKNWPLARVGAEMAGVGPGLTQSLVVQQQTEVQSQQQL